MIINPIFVLVSIYFSANLYAFFSALIAGGFYSYGNFYRIESQELISSFFLQAISLLTLVIFFKYNQKKYQRSNFCIDKGWGYFLFAITILFFSFSQYYGVGIAGSDFKFEETSFLNYIFVLLQPDIWYFLIAPHLRSNRLFWICSLTLLLSLIMRGWMGGVMLIGVVFLIRNYPLKVQPKNFAIFLFTFLFIAILLPFLDAFKWGMRSNMTAAEVIALASEMDYVEVFPVVFQSVIDRFQNYNYVVFSLHERKQILSSILDGEVNWFFQGGIFNSIYCKFFSCGKDIGVYAAELVSGGTDLSWNIDVGISGWIFILGYSFLAYLIFSYFLLYFGYRIYGRNFGLKGIMIFGSFSLVYFFHGWNNAFFNLIIYAFAYQLVLRLRIHETVKTTAAL